ncbi:hypothetical protein VNO78_04903 [Psophocarpus tetragonolobus]|uniref:Uncharacterized protein n=1 Tax=Psophocarpus tetragonolobus TaxID=3891 RepID=A0AAN9XQL6_PSOTE
MKSSIISSPRLFLYSWYSTVSCSDPIIELWLPSFFDRFDPLGAPANFPSSYFMLFDFFHYALDTSQPSCGETPGGRNVKRKVVENGFSLEQGGFVGEMRSCENHMHVEEDEYILENRWYTDEEERIFNLCPVIPILDEEFAKWCVLEIVVIARDCD